MEENIWISEENGRKKEETKFSKTSNKDNLSRKKSQKGAYYDGRKENLSKERLKIMVDLNLNLVQEV